MSKQDKPTSIPQGTHNMPQFQQMQYAFANWIRKPDATTTPQNIERRRMNIYRELFLSNVKGFIENAFPVAVQTLGQEKFQPLIEQFFETHLSESPYFREIPQEFMAWIIGTPEAQKTVPPWLPELLHYEWLELYVSTLDDEVPEAESNEPLLMNKPVVFSPFFAMAAYRWPVHEISPENQPAEMPAMPTLLAAYRQKNHHVRFMMLPPKAALLLEILQNSPGLTPEEAAQQAAQQATSISTEGRSSAVLPRSEFKQLFQDLKERDILLGNIV